MSESAGPRGNDRRPMKKMRRMHHAQLDCHAKNSSGMTLATWAHGSFRQTNETLGECGMMTKPKGNASNLAGTARATRRAQEATIADARTTLQIRHSQCDSPVKKTQVARHERPGPTANSARRTKKLSECGVTTKTKRNARGLAGKGRATRWA